MDLISGVDDSIGADDDGQELLVERQDLVMLEHEGILTLALLVTLKRLNQPTYVGLFQKAGPFTVNFIC